jgi:hypothetical protein
LENARDLTRREGAGASTLHRPLLFLAPRSVDSAPSSSRGRGSALGGLASRKCMQAIQLPT